MPLSTVALGLAIGWLPQGAQAPAADGRPPPRDHEPSATSSSRRHGSDRDNGNPAPPDGDDVQVSSPSPANQEETVLRVDPSDRLHLIGGAIDDRSGQDVCAFYATMDGGLTWSELFFSDARNPGRSWDPCAAIGPSGESYFGVAGKTVFVGRSFDGGGTVPGWVEVDPNPGGAIDRPNMSVDTVGDSNSGAVYVCWTRLDPSSGQSWIYFSASFDGGQTWTARTRVSDSNLASSGYPAVGPNGEVYVVYLDLKLSAIKFDYSLDAGATWHKDVGVTRVSFMSSIPNAPFPTGTFPVIAVDTSAGPYRGNIYVVWNEDTGTSTAPNPDVLLSRSTDAGVTWSKPIPASDVTTNAQFMPWIDVDAEGNVNVGFYDRRDDPADTKIRYYVSRSSDGGVTFQPNVMVSDQGFDPNTYSDGSDIGDMTGVAASDRTVHALWTDGRNATNDIFTSRVELDLHTDVSGLSAAAGGTVNLTLNPGPLQQSADYRILGSISGTSPGIDFGAVNLPLNYDALMLATIVDANSSALPGFSGALDATGSAMAAVISGPLPPALVGLQIDFAALVSIGRTVKWASNPTRIEILS